MVYGKATPFTSVNLDDIALGNGGFRITGENAGDNAGVSVSSAGDINGDGYGDIIVGAFLRQAGGTNAGAAYVVYGKAAPITAINLDTIALGNGGFRIMGENAGSYVGYRVSTAGDINGDGYGDIIVSADNNDAGGPNAGAAYVVYGKATPITSVNLDDIALGTGGFRITGEAAGDDAGVSVSSAGDINGDGYDDIIVGAFSNDAGGSSAGAAYVVYGKATRSRLSISTTSHSALVDSGSRARWQTIKPAPACPPPAISMVMVSTISWSAPMATIQAALALALLTSSMADRT